MIDININIVECKCCYQVRIPSRLFYININIVECKSDNACGEYLNKINININIVECKYAYDNFVEMYNAYKYKHSGM